jgi:hypothetical protein
MSSDSDSESSKDPKDYVWAFDNTSDSNENVNYMMIRIVPKNDFYYDGGLSHILNLPKEFRESYETVFEIKQCVDVRKIMKELGFEYSQKLYDQMNKDSVDLPANCQCYMLLGYHIDDDINFCNYYTPQYKWEESKTAKMIKLNKQNEPFKLNKSRHELITINKNAKCYSGVAHVKVAYSSINRNFHLYDLKFEYENKKKRKTIY